MMLYFLLIRFLTMHIMSGSSQGIEDFSASHFTTHLESDDERTTSSVEPYQRHHHHHHHYYHGCRR